MICDYSLTVNLGEQLTIFTTNSVEYIQRFNADFVARKEGKYVKVASIAFIYLCDFYFPIHSVRTTGIGKH